MTLLTDYYDPDDPPRPSRADEVDRLLGKAAGRLLVWFVFVAVIGGKPFDAWPSLLTLPSWRIAVAAVVFVWFAAPLTYAAEHVLIAGRERLS